MRACERIDSLRQGKTVALCYSGGVDSEIIAIGLKQAGIPFETYFLDIWGANRKAFLAQKESMQRLKISPIEIELNKLYFYDHHSLKVFRSFGIDNPTYLALAYLFEKIPAGQFIVTGDGDLNRSGAAFARLAEVRAATGDTGFALPISAANIFYYLWAEKHARTGEFSFFSSTPGLVASMLEHPLFRAECPTGSTSKVLYHSFPEVRARPKTTNWDEGAYRENVWIREWLERHRKTWPEFDFWRSGIFSTMRGEELFV